MNLQAHKRHRTDNVKSVALYTTKPRELVRKYLRKKAWNWFDWDQNFFLKPNDGISQRPLLEEVHDEEVVQALTLLAQRLPSKFLDIGANIGLVSIALANHVDEVICIEANPLICNILRVNLAINCSKFSIHEYAVGENAGEATLYVPRHNLGGAFLLTSNQYDLDQLAKKDGYVRYEAGNYLTQTVQIRQCDEALAEIRETGCPTLLIKVDVEGLDQVVLESALRIFANLFATSKIAMVFESHDQKIARRIQEETRRWGYEVFGLKIATKPSLRQPLLRRLSKMLTGERKELWFVPLDGVPPEHHITNFACCPEQFLS